MRLPEEHHIPVVGVHPLVHVLMQGRVAEVDRAALAEIAFKEGVELVKEFLAKFREVPDRKVNILFELWEYTVLVVAGLDAHQVDEPGVPLDLRSYEDIP